MLCEQDPVAFSAEPFFLSHKGKALSSGQVSESLANAWLASGLQNKVTATDLRKAAVMTVHTNDSRMAGLLALHMKHSLSTSEKFYKTMQNANDSVKITSALRSHFFFGKTLTSSQNIEPSAPNNVDVVCNRQDPTLPVTLCEEILSNLQPQPGPEQPTIKNTQPSANHEAATHEDIEQAKHIGVKRKLATNAIEEPKTEPKKRRAFSDTERELIMSKFKDVIAKGTARSDILQERLKSDPILKELAHKFTFQQIRDRVACFIRAEKKK